MLQRLGVSAVLVGIVAVGCRSAPSAAIDRSSSETPPDGGEAELPEQPFTYTNDPVLDAGPPSLWLATKECDRKRVTTLIELRGNYYTVTRAASSRRGYILRRDESALRASVWAIRHLAEPVDAGEAAGTLRFEYLDELSYQPTLGLLRYDPSQPTDAVRAIRERLQAVTIERPPHDELDVLDCLQATTRNGDEVVSDTVSDPFGHVHDPHFVRVAPTAAAWATFWTTADSIGVWSWAPRYQTSKNFHTDGCWYRLHLTHGPRTVDMSSYLATPPRWNELRAALERLLSAQ
jgi:hypothetical protein